MNLIKIVISICFFVIFNRITINGQNINSTNGTLTTIENVLSTNSCIDGSINPPSCTECPLNHQKLNNQCVLSSNQEKPTISIARRLFFLFIGGVITIILILGMAFAYNRLMSSNQSSRRSFSNNFDDGTNNETNLGRRFRQIFQNINLRNLGKRSRLNFFSVSNNNSSSGQHRATENSRSQLNENPDEALLFDDPYADTGLSGGLPGSSGNPYKSLTLSVS